MDYFVLSFRSLSDEQLNVKNALIMFSVKDKDLFGMANQYIAECLLSFDTIFNGSGNDQIHLTLTRPNNLGLSLENILISIWK